MFFLKKKKKRKILEHYITLILKQNVINDNRTQRNFSFEMKFLNEI